MFISFHTTIYFFVKDFFSNVYISVNTLLECSNLFFGQEIGHPLSNYATGGMEGEVIQNVYRCVQGERVSRLKCMYALTLSLFMFLFYDVLFYLQKFNLTLSGKGVFVRNGSIFLVMK